MKIKIAYLCDYCQKVNYEKPSHYYKSKRHFCNKDCYGKYRAELLPKEEHNNWKGGITPAQAHKRWILRHRGRYSFLRHKEYLKKKNVKGSHTFEEWALLKERNDNKCVGCGELKPLTKDHIVPLGLGGNDSIANIQPLCRNCNSRKWMKIFNFNIYENPELIK